MKIFIPFFVLSLLFSFAAVKFTQTALETLNYDVNCEFDVLEQSNIRNARCIKIIKDENTEGDFAIRN